MKKFILICGLVLAVGFANAQNSVSLTVQPNTFTNLLSFVGGNASAKVTTVVASRVSTGTATLLFIDNSTNSLIWTNQAYSDTIRYATNVVTLWTNYFGLTNYITNIGLVSASRTVAANSGLIAPTISMTVPASDTLVLNPVDYIFRKGIWVTNQGASNAIVTITYE